MRPSVPVALATLAILLSCPLAATAQNAGPDLRIADLPSTLTWGVASGVGAYSLATTSCNDGTTGVAWNGMTAQHPVIAQHLYRWHDGRFEQIGLSWAMHGFATLNDPFCGTCAGGTLHLLGPGCSNAHSAGLNGTQFQLGPRALIDASSGGFPFPLPPANAFTLTERRLQVADADLDPAAYPGARYFIEAQHVAADDAAVGNAANNASYREVTVTPLGSTYDLTVVGTTTSGKPAILAWPELDPGVVIETVGVPGEGRFHVAFRAAPAAAGLWRWEFAVHNYDSHRSACALDVAIPTGATVTNAGFHDVDYHSGDGDQPGTDFDGADWTCAITATTASWSTSSFLVDPNANALRWGTTYNYRFDCDMPPPTAGVNATLTLYRPGLPSSVSVTLVPHDVVSIASGDGQLGLKDNPLAQPLIVDVVDGSGSPLPGEPVTFSVINGQGALTVTSTLTDAVGRAQTSVTPTGTGALDVRAAIADGHVDFTAFARGMNVAIIPGPDILTVNVVETSAGSAFVPYILMVGNPQPTFPTPVGLGCLNPFNLAQTAVFCDGIGDFGYINVQGQPCIGTPNLNNFYTGVGPLIGVPLVFQAIGYNAALPPHWWLSNCATLP